MKRILLFSPSIPVPHSVTHIYLSLLSFFFFLVLTHFILPSLLPTSSSSSSSSSSPFPSCLHYLLSSTLSPSSLSHHNFIIPIFLLLPTSSIPLYSLYISSSPIPLLAPFLSPLSSLFFPSLYPHLILPTSHSQFPLFPLPSESFLLGPCSSSGLPVPVPQHDDNAQPVLLHNTGQSHSGGL